MSREEQQLGHPPIDPELAQILAANPALTRPILPRHLEAFRAANAAAGLSDEALSHNGKITVSEIELPSSTRGVTNSGLVLRPSGLAEPRPGLCYFHGGGMIAGTCRTGLETVVDWVTELGIVIVSVGYRLAPEHPHPIPVEDCYAAVRWVADSREALVLEDRPLIVAGSSAGGGLAAGVALLSRERDGPSLSDQVLLCPMLDDRAQAMSATSFDGYGTWDRRSNRTAWEALLGDRCGGAGIPSAAAPSRETMLANLPAAYIDVGAVETFRDEAIDYGQRLGQAGVPLELHVWSGAYHGFEAIAPASAVAVAARETRLGYLRRRLAVRASQ